MKNGGFLILPRARVFWGDVNLTAYDGPSKGAPEVFLTDAEKGGPIVFDVRAELSSEGEGPTAEMKWDPTGAGLAAYEWFVSQPKYLQGKFSVEFFYPGGKRIVMFFKWSGQTINYGNDMTITVKLQSELAGLVNANQRSTAQAYDEKEGADATTAYSKLTKQYGLSGYPDILSYNKYAREQAKKVKLIASYGIDQTYGSSVANLAKQSGHMAYPNAVGVTGIIIMPPYSYKGKGEEDQEVLDAFTDIGAGGQPDPKIRYGYLLGPAIINNVSRQYEWKPPQQENSKTPGTQTRPRDAQGRYRTLTAAERAQKDEETAGARTSSPIGVSGGRANPGVQNKDNPEGPDRQIALNEEKSAQLTFDTLMCPVITGIKPHDIVFIPSLKGEFIEDWIVQSVGYSQSNGKVNVSVKATRIFGLDSAMNKTAAEKFKKLATKLRLVGSEANLDAWDAYAWSLPKG